MTQLQHNTRSAWLVHPKPPSKRKANIWPNIKYWQCFRIQKAFQNEKSCKHFQIRFLLHSSLKNNLFRKIDLPQWADKKKKKHSSGKIQHSYCSAQCIFFLQLLQFHYLAGRHLNFYCISTSQEKNVRRWC